MTGDNPVFQTEMCSKAGTKDHKLKDEARRSYTKTCSSCARNHKRWLQRREIEEIWARDADAEAEAESGWEFGDWDM